MTVVCTHAVSDLSGAGSPRSSRRRLWPSMKLLAMVSGARSCAGRPCIHSHVVEWRKAAQAGAQAGLGPATRDRRDKEIEALRARAEKAEAELSRTKAALDLVGKAHALLETLSESAEPAKRSRR